jgi:hypothetical protein
MLVEPPPGCLPRTAGSRLLATVALVHVLAACTSLRGPRIALPSNAPYPPSSKISAVHWDFGSPTTSRRATGSDLWPCTWARDDALYCAWGDGGGFDGNDDHVGRVSLGFARISGGPSEDGRLRFAGKNVWGAPPYAEHAATFGGKAVSMISVHGILYAVVGLWTRQNADNPVLRSERGPLQTLIWSVDLGATWTIAPWSLTSSLGTFLNFGRDNAGALDHYVYIYYARDGDARLYLKRVDSRHLTVDPAIPGAYQYYAGGGARSGSATWSSHESDAAAVFADPNRIDDPQVIYDAPLHRYLMTAGHDAPGPESPSSIGNVGLFESPHPWGPWATVGYYEDWGAFGASGAGDYLGLNMSPKWSTKDGKTLWCIFSGLNAFDSFNVVKATLTSRPLFFWERRESAGQEPRSGDLQR